ncbi:MAG: penicillin-binding protein, partial [Clostridia bacterium]|nr:penicillin-binding protein [Clostridia bacterium]
GQTTPPVPEAPGAPVRPAAVERDLFSDSQSHGPAVFYEDEGDDMENLSSSAAPAEAYADENGKSKRGVRIAKQVGKIVLSAALIMIIIGCIVVSSFAVYVFGFVDDSFDYDLYELTLDYTTTIYVQDKNYQPQSESDPAVKWVAYQDLYYENRTWVNINDIDQDLIYAFIAAEDERFYKHNGVDWKRTVASFANLFLHFWDTEQGGSTITQQLIKNLTEDNEVSAMRKIREIMRARNVESTYAKDTIMECYLNVIYLGHGCYGVEAAAEYYFGKSAKDLTISEAAAIAATAKSPAGFNPTDNPKNNKYRREWIIKNMCAIRDIYDGERGITEKERDAALKEKITVLNHKNDSEVEEGQTASKNAYSWFTDALFEQLVSDLMEQKGISKEGATNKIYRGGLKIYATMDSKIQSAAETVFATDEYWAAVLGTEQKAQAAITIMDYEGHVVAICGGRGVKTGKLELNRAVDAPRQPGSSMKPIGIYSPALEANVITWSTLVDNTSLTVGGVTFHNDSYQQTEHETIQAAIQRSYNLVAARVYLMYNNPQKLFDFVTQRFGITTLIQEEVIDGKTFSDVGLSQLALGGSTYGLTTVEEAAAYATFGNGGLYYKPTFYTQVTDQNNKAVLTYDFEPVQAISPETSYIMNRMLQIAATNGTGAGSGFGGWEVYGKTGTTNSNKDRWFAGGTPYYVGSCWFGCDIPYNMSRLSPSGNPAIRLWRPIMQAAHEGLAKKSYPTCKNVIRARYCTDSGELATTACEHVEWGYYKKDYAPVCTLHEGGRLLTDSDPDPTGLPVSSETPASSEEAASGETLSGDTPSTDTPSGDTPSGDTPSQEVSSESTSSEETPSDSSAN